MQAILSIPATSSAAPARRMPRLPVLDGWRGISILFVLAAHMLPLGPNRWQLNESFGVTGMAIFFSLSGFFITSTLVFHPSVGNFAIRRLFRIVPVAWLFLLIVLPFVHASPAMWRADLLFYTNLPPYYLLDITGHLWSLCVEVQFYLAIGIAFLLLRRRALALLPFACIAVTLGRIPNVHLHDIVTIYRVDEILSGASLAYLFHSDFCKRLKQIFTRMNPLIPITFLLLSSYPALPWMNYLRPYFAAMAVGTTLFREGTRLNRFLESRPLAYLATISYALYVWHPMATHGWFQEGGKLMKYAKRPLGIVMSLGLAHLSTFYFERYFTDLGKRLTGRKKLVTAHPMSLPLAS